MTESLSDLVTHSDLRLADFTVEQLLGRGKFSEVFRYVRGDPSRILYPILCHSCYEVCVGGFVR
jgi:hypothetical protein